MKLNFNLAMVLFMMATPLLAQTWAPVPATESRAVAIPKVDVNDKTGNVAVPTLSLPLRRLATLKTRVKIREPPL